MYLESQRLGEAWLLLNACDLFDAEESVGAWLADDDPPVLVLWKWIVRRVYRLGEDLELFQVFFFGGEVGLVQVPLDGDGEVKRAFRIFVEVDLEIVFAILDFEFQIWVPIANLCQRSHLLLSKLDELFSLVIIHIHEIGNILHLCIVL